MNRVSIILPAAGRSTRFGGERNKLHEPLAGITVIGRAVRAFVDRPDVQIVMLATGPDQTPHEVLGLDSSEPLHARLRFTLGGPSRAHSVYLALQQLPDDVEWVAIHDAARPLVSAALIDQTLAAARQYGAAVPAMPVPLTVKQADGPLPAKVQRTLPRHTLWAMQTPQVMRRAELLHAYATCPIPLDQVTDDAQLLELSGRDVWLVEGEERNVKITTQADLQLAELFLKQRRRSATL